MKRVFLIVLSTAVFAFVAVSAVAVDKVPRPTPTVDTTDRLNPVPPTAPSDQSGSAKTSQSDKYDTFIDSNSNGVDDRQENLVGKEKAAEKTEPKPDQPADSTDKK